MDNMLVIADFGPGLLLTECMSIVRTKICYNSFFDYLKFSRKYKNLRQKCMQLNHIKKLALGSSSLDGLAVLVHGASCDSGPQLAHQLHVLQVDGDMLAVDGCEVGVPKQPYQVLLCRVLQVHDGAGLPAETVCV